MRIATAVAIAYVDGKVQRKGRGLYRMRNELLKELPAGDTQSAAGAVDGAPAQTAQAEAAPCKLAADGPPGKIAQAKTATGKPVDGPQAVESQPLSRANLKTAQAETAPGKPAVAGAAAKSVQVTGAPAKLAKAEAEPGKAAPAKRPLPDLEAAVEQPARTRRIVGNFNTGPEFDVFDFLA